MKNKEQDILLNPDRLISLSRKILFTDNNLVKKINKSHEQFIFNNNILVLDLCSEELRNDKNLVLQLLKTNGNNLALVKNEFKDDKKLVLAAIKSKPESFQYASERLRDDSTLVYYTLNFAPRQIRYAGSRFKEDKEIVAKLLVDSPVIIQYIHDDLKNDLDILLQLWTDIKKEIDDTFKHKANYLINDMGSKMYPFFNQVNIDVDDSVIIQQMDSCFNNLILQRELNQPLNKQTKKLKV